MRKDIIPPILLFIVSFVIILWLSSSDNEFNPWLYRILGAFAASGLSVVIPGSLNVGANNFKSLAQESPKLTATGAMAVFVLVYLFNPNW
ncbi:hypothetical protein [uncultured Winogradskyella sp.]|uniref:hypothetical protein n=1 Tax=uncultured Winogradskyella sp. TaxID=395353 RepID=UPI00260E4759|nr:hypothetical protein [uncultured Winogradskyella sp.]